MRALFVLSPTESKRLIARAVANMEEVKEAFKDDKLVIGHGSSAGAVAEEILGKEKLAELMDRNMYVTGMIENGVLCCTVSQGKPPL